MAEDADGNGLVHFDFCTTYPALLEEKVAIYNIYYILGVRPYVDHSVVFAGHVVARRSDLREAYLE